MNPSSLVLRMPRRDFATLVLLISLIAAGRTFAAAPPLSLDGLRDEKLPAAPAKPQAELKANDPCYVCHGNMKEDKLVFAHAAGKVSCIDCHGPSVAHRNDEDNITPPDKMFARDQIDSMCSECHGEHDVPARDVIRRLQERKLASTKSGEIACTSCHFEHRLAHRVVEWDKKTRKLLSRETPAKTGGGPAAGSRANTSK